MNYEDVDGGVEVVESALEEVSQEKDLMRQRTRASSWDPSDQSLKDVAEIGRLPIETLLNVVML